MRRHQINSWAGRIVPACVLALICVPFVNAQTMASVSGRITDRHGEGMPGATVKLYSRSRPPERLGTLTDKSGDYRFERLAPGDYLVGVQAEGFTRSITRQLHIESGANPTLDFSLEIAGVREELVITSSGTAQTFDEVSKSITVVSQREMDERDEILIPEALRTVPGLRIRQLGGPGMPVSISSRGLRSQDTAILIDGLRLRDAAAEQGDAASLLSTLVVTDLSRVEVLRGAGSSLYGTNAIGCVINVVSNEGGGPLRGNFLLEGGSLDLYRARMRVAGAAGEGNRVIYSAGLTHLNVTRGVDHDDASRTTSTQERVSFRLTPKTTLSARLYASDAFTQLNQDPSITFFFFPPPPGIIKAVTLAPAEIRRLDAGIFDPSINFRATNFLPSINDPDKSATARFFSGAIIFMQQPTRNLSYTISYQGLKTLRSTSDGTLAFDSFFNQGIAREDKDGLIHTFNGRVDFRPGRANFINAGYEFESEKLTRVSSFETFASLNNAVDISQRSHTFFVQDQLNFLDRRLQLSVAFRSQFFSLGHPRFKPDVNDPFSVTFEAPPNAYTGDGSIAYFFDKTQTKFRAHVGNGYRAPSLTERFDTSFMLFFTCPTFPCGTLRGRFAAVGDLRLRPERSIAFDAGIDQTFYKDRLRATATYFYTKLQGVIEFGFLGDARIFPFDPGSDAFGRSFSGYLNKRGRLARGFELSVTAAPTRSLDLSASYTYTNSDESIPRALLFRSFIIPDRSQDEVIRSFFIPEHQFSLVATQRIGRRVLINFDLVASSNYITPMPEQSSSFSQLYEFAGLVKADLSASYTLPLEGTRAIRFFGKVENLLDQRYFEAGFRTPGRTGVAGMVFSF